MARRKKGTDAGNLRLINIAQIHEFGAPKAGVPARPFVRPTVQRVQKRLLQAWKRALRDTIRGRVFTPKLGGARG
jgi:hypothetical protein